MHDLIKCYKECMNDLHAIEIYPNISAKDVKATVQQKTWGLCKSRRALRTRHNADGSISNYYVYEHRITISKRLIDDTTPYSSLRQTMFHELLHACDECYSCGHKGKWAEYASLVSDCYNTDISVGHSSEEMGCTVTYRKYYVTKCMGCGKLVVRNGVRMPKFYKNACEYQHICGGRLHAVGVFDTEEYEKIKSRNKVGMA